MDVNIYKYVFCILNVLYLYLFSHKCSNGIFSMYQVNFVNMTKTTAVKQYIDRLLSNVLNTKIITAKYFTININ